MAISATHFRFRCAKHNQFLAGNPLFAEEFPNDIRNTDWVIDLSEMICPDERAGDGDTCNQNWEIASSTYRTQR